MFKKSSKHATMLMLYFLLFIFLYSTTKHLLRKLRNNPPGPFLTLPFIGHVIHLIISNKPSLHKKLHALSKKHGPILYLQLGFRKVLVVSSTWAVEECVFKNDLIFANRPNLLAGKYEGYNFNSMSWAPYGDHWRNLRKIAHMELLSPQSMDALSYIVLEDVKALVVSIFHLSEENSIVDMRTLMLEYLYNVTTTMILGRRYYGEKALISDEAKEFRGIIEEMHDAVDISVMIDFIPWLPWSSKAEASYKAVHERRDKFLQGMIERIRKIRNDDQSNDECSTALVQVLLSLHESDPEYYDEETIKGIMAVLLTGGSDSSVSTMEWAMTLLLNHPTVIEKAQAEIDKHVGHNRLIDDADFTKLPYLNCILKETLRLYPNVPLLMPHESSEETIVGGFRVPHGTMLLINAWTLHHDSEIWDDPLAFKPERFMTSTSIEKQGNITDTNREEFKHMSFGKGRRGCPAEGLATHMIGLALGTLLQCFHWERISKEMEDLGETSGVSITKTWPLMAKCQLHKSAVNILSGS